MQAYYYGSRLSRNFCLSFRYASFKKKYFKSLPLHGFLLSRRHLISILKAHILCRRQYSDLQEVRDFINEQMRGPGRHHGYRWMYPHRVSHHTTFPRPSLCACKIVIHRHVLKKKNSMSPPVIHKVFIQHS